MVADKIRSTVNTLTPNLSSSTIEISGRNGRKYRLPTRETGSMTMMMTLRWTKNKASLAEKRLEQSTARPRR